MQGALCSCVGCVDGKWPVTHSSTHKKCELERDEGSGRLRETRDGSSRESSGDCELQEFQGFCLLIGASVNQPVLSQNARTTPVPGNCSPKQRLCSCIHRFHIVIVPLCWLHQQDQARARQPSFPLPLAHQLVNPSRDAARQYPISVSRVGKEEFGKGYPVTLAARCGSPQSQAE